MKRIVCLTLGLLLGGSSYVFSQGCGNDSIYHLPYKDTYVKEPLVAENNYRIAKPKYMNPGTLKRPGIFCLYRFGTAIRTKSICTGGHGK